MLREVHAQEPYRPRGMVRSVPESGDTGVRIKELDAVPRALLRAGPARGSRTALGRRRLRVAARSHWDLAQQRAGGNGDRPRVLAQAGRRLGRPPHDRPDRERRHAVPRRLGDDGAGAARSRPASRRAPDRARRARRDGPPARDPSGNRRLGRRAGRSSRSSTSRSTARPTRNCSPRCSAISNACSTTCASRPTDWLKMLARLHNVVDELAAHPPPIDADDLTEGTALLTWMGDQHFTFLGCRSYDLSREDGEDVLRPVPGTGLGLLRNAPEAPSRSFADLPPEIRARAREQRLLVLTKANRRSTIHRPTYLDYVGVRRFDEHGDGDRRTPLPRPVHLLGVQLQPDRRPVAAPQGRGGRRTGRLPPRESRPEGPDRDPRDLSARRPVPDRRRRRSTRTRWGSCACRNAARCACSSTARSTAGSCRAWCSSPATATRHRYACRSPTILTEAFQARSHEWNVRLGESVLARLHFVLHVDPRDRDSRRPRRARSADRGGDTRAGSTTSAKRSSATRGEEDGLELLHQWGDAFPAAYRDDFDAEETLADLVVLRDLEAARWPRGPPRRWTAITAPTSSSTAPAASRRCPRCCRASPTWASSSRTNARTTSARAGSNRVGSSTSGCACPSTRSRPARPDTCSRTRSSRC